MRYVALLRGINVGGNNILPMAELAAVFEGLRYSAVRTYIASGNVIFETTGADPRALERRIERALEKAHGYAGKVVIRDREQMLAVVRGMPRSWRRPDPDVRHNVLFLRHGIDRPDIVEELDARPGLEEVAYQPGVLYWSAHRRDLTRTAMVKLSARPIYQELTVRNLNTAKKLAELVGPS